jgi:hypothetical protein
MLINHPFVLKVVRIAATYRNDKNVRVFTEHLHKGAEIYGSGCSAGSSGEL